MYTDTKAKEMEEEALFWQRNSRRFGLFAGIACIIVGILIFKYTEAFVPSWIVLLMTFPVNIIVTKQGLKMSKKYLDEADRIQQESDDSKEEY